MLSVAITFVRHLILFIFVLFIHLSKHTALPTSINYIAVSVDFNCFRIYLLIYLFTYLFIYLFVICSFYCVYFLLLLLILSWPASISTATCGARRLRIHCKITKYCCKWQISLPGLFKYYLPLCNPHPLIDHKPGKSIPFVFGIPVV